MGISPAGTEMALGHTNGTVTVLHLVKRKWKAKFCLDLEVWQTCVYQYLCIIAIENIISCRVFPQSLPLSISSKLAVASQNGNLNIYTRSKLLRVSS